MVNYSKRNNTNPEGLVIQRMLGTKRLAQLAAGANIFFGLNDPAWATSVSTTFFARKEGIVLNKSCSLFKTKLSKAAYRLYFPGLNKINRRYVPT